MPGTQDHDSYADRKLRASFTVKGVSKETMDAIRAREARIMGDDDQTEILKQMGGQES
jgi:hypothetical protein